ncbi:MAG: nickel-responsive transcriptional regulator NikR [Rhodospirillales bacterium]|nr:MAG: nickel-responsive transcriptional regulator NikR [Rhodospirillales bacterium]
MQRITITIEPALLQRLDAFMAQSGATNRSEALRDLVRRGLGTDGAVRQNPEAECVGVISYALAPEVRDLGRRVPKSRHERHDKAIVALSVPLDHNAAVEVAVMRGSVGAVSDYANSLFLERGIEHGRLSLIPVKTEIEVHAHGSGEAQSHSHLRVKDSF